MASAIAPFGTPAFGPRISQKSMIGVAAAVVSNGCPDRLGHLVETTQQILDREIGQVRIRFDRLVQVVDVCLVMLVVMELHRLGVDVGLEGIVRESQRRQLVSHVGASLNVVGEGQQLLS